jgi:hypothetical protein
MKQNVQSKWLQTLQSPFVHPSVHIPDDRTAVSGLVSSRETFAFAPTTASGIAQTTHTSGIVFWPYPAVYRTTFVEQTGSAYGTLATGSAVGNANVPNISSMLPGAGGNVRLVSMGLRVIYEGTELNRAGKIFVGTAGITTAAIASSTINTGVYVLEPLSVLTGSVQPTQTVLKSVLNNTVTARISDGLFEANWIPGGVPSYQVSQSVYASLEPSSATTAGAVLSSSLWNCPSGGAGNESGQNALVLIIEGDITASSAVGNTYAIEVISHWEVIPVNPLAVAYDLTPSLSDFTALSRAMNNMSLNGGFRYAGPVSNLRARGTMVQDFRSARSERAPRRPTQPASRRQIKASSKVTTMQKPKKRKGKRA